MTKTKLEAVVIGLNKAKHDCEGHHGVDDPSTALEPLKIQTVYSHYNYLLKCQWRKEIKRTRLSNKKTK